LLARKKKQFSFEMGEKKKSRNENESNNESRSFPGSVVLTVHFLPSAFAFFYSAANWTLGVIVQRDIFPLALVFFYSVE